MTTRYDISITSGYPDVMKVQTELYCNQSEAVMKHDHKNPSAEERATELENQVMFADSDAIKKAKELAAKILARAEQEIANAKNRKPKQTRVQKTPEQIEVARILAEAKATAKAIREQKQQFIGPQERAILESAEYKNVLHANRIKKPLNPESATAVIWEKFFANRQNLDATKTKELSEQLGIDLKYGSNWACMMRKAESLIELGILSHEGNMTAKGRQMSIEYKQKLASAIIADKF